MINDNDVVLAEYCSCGLAMNPELMPVTTFGEAPKWLIIWRCIADNQYGHIGIIRRGKQFD